MRQLLACTIAIAALGLSPVMAQTAPAPAKIVKHSGVWIEGPGATITYGQPYDECANRCLANSACKMIEYYRPEKKCNQYQEIRQRLKGGSSDVGIKQ